MRVDSIRFDRNRCIHARGRYHFARASSARPPSYPVIPRAKTTHDTTAAKTVSAFRLPGVISRRRRRRPTGVSRRGYLHTVSMCTSTTKIPYCNHRERENTRNDQRMKFERGGTGARCPRVRRARAESTASERGDDRARTSTRYEDGSFTDRSFVAFVARERSRARARARERARRVRENSIVERAAPTETPIDSRCPRARCEARTRPRARRRR